MKRLLIDTCGKGFLAVEVLGNDLTNVLIFGPEIPFSWAGAKIKGCVSKRGPDGKSFFVTSDCLSKDTLIQSADSKITEGQEVWIRITHDQSLFEHHKGYKGKFVHGTCAPESPLNWLSAISKMCQRADEVKVNDSALTVKLQDLGLQNISYTLDESVLDTEGFGDLFDSLRQTEWVLKESKGSVSLDRSRIAWCFDVNISSGDAASRSSIKKVNHEAWLFIRQHIQLLNLSGLILIDFVEMNRMETSHLLNKIQRDQGVKDIHVLGMSRAGLVELTRSRTGYPLWDLLELC